jgi:hypothetical protein
MESFAELDGRRAVLAWDRRRGFVNHLWIEGYGRKGMAKHLGSGGRRFHSSSWAGK